MIHLRAYYFKIYLTLLVLFTMITFSTAFCQFILENPYSQYITYYQIYLSHKLYEPLFIFEFGFIEITIGDHTHYLRSKFYAEKILQPKFVLTFLQNLDWETLITLKNTKLISKEDVVSLFRDYINQEHQKYLKNLITPENIKISQEIGYNYLKNYAKTIHMSAFGQTQVDKIIEHLINSIPWDCYIQTVDYQTNMKPFLIKQFDLMYTNLQRGYFFTAFAKENFIFITDVIKASYKIPLSIAFGLTAIYHSAKEILPKSTALEDFTLVTPGALANIQRDLQVKYFIDESTLVFFCLGGLTLVIISITAYKAFRKAESADLNSIYETTILDDNSILGIFFISFLLLLLINQLNNKEQHFKPFLWIKLKNTSCSKNKP